MPKEAMNLTFGDLMIIEIALIMYLKDMDLSMQAGQNISAMIGKIEYAMQQIKLQEDRKIANTFAPPTPPDAPPKP